MEELLFNIDEAIEFSKRGKIEEWVHLFLNSVGDNKPFSEGLKLQKRYWLGPILIEIDKLTRCCGPEPHMQFVDSLEAWEKHIGRFQELVRDGWDMAPLIVQSTDGKLIVNDGNHRLEAMKRENYDKCWAIIWDSENNLKKYEEEYGEEISMAQSRVFNREVEIEIKDILNRFQEGYTKRDLSNVDNYMKELFVNDDSIVIVGTADCEWCLGLNDLKELLENDWNYWGDIDIDYENAKINSKDNTAWFVADSTLKYEYQEGYYDQWSEGLKDYFFGEEGTLSNGKPLQKLGVMNWMTTFLVKSMQGEKGRDYILPLRLSGVMVKEDDKWLIKRLQYSMPMSKYPEHRLNKDNIESEEYTEAKEKMNKHNERHSDCARGEIIDTLKETQSNYLNDKVNIEDFIENMFSNCEDIYVVDPNENPAAIGKENIKGIVLEQREKWDDMILDIDEAIVSSQENTAQIFTNGIFKKSLNKEEIISKLLDDTKNIFGREGKGEENLFEIQKEIAYAFRELANGEECLWPFRFQAFLIREDNKWRYHNIQFTFPSACVFEGNYNMTKLL